MLGAPSWRRPAGRLRPVAAQNSCVPPRRNRLSETWPNCEDRRRSRRAAAVRSRSTGCGCGNNGAPDHAKEAASRIREARVRRIFRLRAHLDAIRQLRVNSSETTIDLVVPGTILRNVARVRQFRLYQFARALCLGCVVPSFGSEDIKTPIVVRSTSHARNGRYFPMRFCDASSFGAAKSSCVADVTPPCLSNLSGAESLPRYARASRRTSSLRP